MKHTASKIFRALCGIVARPIYAMSIVVMPAIMAGITSIPVLAASNPKGGVFV